MSDNKKLSPSILLNVILFGFMGQVAWAVENNFFNLYMLKIGGDMHDISVMIAVSAIVAFLTTLFMGSLSDKLNKRKIFICAGYILWGLTVIAFAVINPESIAKLMGTEVGAAIPLTVTLVIIMDGIMTFMGSTSNDAAFNAWVTDIGTSSNRSKIESLLAIIPVIATLAVTGSFGAIFGDSKEVGQREYSLYFLILGSIVTVCGVIGIFSVKESRTNVKTTAGFGETLVYGFKPSVIKNNKSLYISLVCMGIFSVSSQVFFPYIFIYLDKHLDMSALGSMLSPGVIIFALVFIIALVAALVYIIIMSDRNGKAPYLYPAVTFYLIGLILVFFADDNILYFLFAALVTIVGYGLLMIMLGAAVRDFTPEDKTGQLQGIRMIFSVLIPMLIGPSVAERISNAYSVTTYVNDYGETLPTPAPHIFLASALIGALIIIPLYFLSKEFEKQKALNK
ncbi:MAG: MFS transporter [Clostridia bacterium]|nr:MFS transporter [Clostridia bacterium]MBQ7122303.1 MFS transporter [Clostridia bacterium]